MAFSSASLPLPPPSQGLQLSIELAALITTTTTMKDSKTPPLSDGSSACSKDSPFESTPTSLLPNYTDATGSAARPSNQVDQIALTLKNASLKLCDGPGLTPDERKEVDKALTKGVQIALSSAKLDICNLDDLKAHLKLLNLFDRLRQHVQDGTEYFDYPSCQQAQDDGHIGAPGIDAPPPPYAPTAELPPPTNAKSGRKPT
ncbi:hypothetical protein NDA11_002888 [Ustilago hordei]|nr:hypothetical protein NDA10_005896 [Ustilago hordei]KAJ1585073.1 hypothetical protein NDA15_002590 [Ustilago hordei]KAJ1587778.1 hypothetical protein NDA12_000629 [Ustilago hordei]KAJ1592896.1 hypothetical protein NDA11_002888 [Ustilago hordei]KAJ1601849.1 hypothetical protein NDA14_007069 [Ustilago hordei]